MPQLRRRIGEVRLALSHRPAFTDTVRGASSRERSSARPGSAPRCACAASASRAICRTWWKARSISSCSFWLTCSSLHMNCWMSCTHSKYDTVTPPALHSTSGMMKMSLLARMASASGVVGPLAPSARIRQRSLAALVLVDDPLQRGRHQHRAGHASAVRRGRSLRRRGSRGSSLPAVDVPMQRRNVEAARRCGWPRSGRRRPRP